MTSISPVTGQVPSPLAQNAGQFETRPEPGRKMRASIRPYVNVKSCADSTSPDAYG